MEDIDDVLSSPVTGLMLPLGYRMCAWVGASVIFEKEGDAARVPE